MSTISSRVIQSKRHEWIVPMNGPWGACYTEVEMALAQAQDTYARIHRVEWDEIPDNTIRVHSEDDERIVISFTVETKGAGSA